MQLASGLQPRLGTPARLKEVDPEELRADVPVYDDQSACQVPSGGC